MASFTAGLLWGVAIWLGHLGEQVTAGLDADFVAAAWGGPTNAGALLCHYVDAFAPLTVLVGIAHVLLIRPTPDS